MRHQNKFLLSSITLAVLTLANQAYAEEQAAKPAKDAVAAETQQVVVTGEASGGVKRKIDSGYSITTATEEQMKAANPLSTADMMKISPGVYVESTGGQTGANIQIRGFPSGGDAPYVSLLLNGSPLFPAPTLSFLANDSTFRMDDTIERVEILRGGPSVILSNGQPGATMNFIMKKGGDTPEGTLRATIGTGNLTRYDVFYGGKLSDGWYGTVGGFYRTQRGVRDPGFPADDGGSFTASLTHKIQDGEFTVYARHTNDKNAFYTGVPVVLTPDGSLSAYPGVDPLKWTPMSNETRLFTLPDGTKGDLADGRGSHGTVIGFDFQQKVNGWSIDNKMNYFNSDQPTIAMFSGPNAMTLQEQVNGFVSSANSNAALVAAAGGVASGLGSAVYVDGGGNVALNTQTVGEGIWTVDKKLKNFTDELRFTKEVIKDHKMTFGLYVSQYSTADTWNLGNHVLMDLSGRPIQVTLNNGVKASNNFGFYDACGFCIAENGDTSNRAFYVADEWKVNDKLTLDAGARYESQKMSLAFQSPSKSNIGNDPLAAYNYNVAQPTGPVTSYNPSWNLGSFTVGGTYKLQKDMSVYVRANSGGQFPFFDQVRGSTPNDPPPVTKIKQVEAGFKTVGSLYSAFIGLFVNKFDSQFQGVSNNSGVPSNTIGGSKTYGIEYEIAVRPLPGLQISFAGDAQHARYQDYDDAVSPGINGKMVQRQPASQWRLSPSYTIPLGDNELKLYGTYTQVNARYSDQQNNEYLPSYHTFDAGALFSIGDKLEFRLSGTNLTNEFGLTEGSAGRSVAGSGGVPYATIARPLFGRAVQLSALYRF